MSNSHTCPYPGCDFPVIHERLACLQHWRILPTDLKQRINSAYKSQNWNAHRAAITEAFEFYKADATT